MRLPDALVVAGVFAQHGGDVARMAEGFRQGAIAKRLRRRLQQVIDPGLQACRHPRLSGHRGTLSLRTSLLGTRCSHHPCFAA